MTDTHESDECTDINIPPEAHSKASWELFRRLKKISAKEADEITTAVCLAMLNAWPGMHVGPAPADARRQSIILPLTETDDEPR